MAAPAPSLDVAVETLYVDGNVVAANKAAGVVTEPGAGHARDSLLNGLVARFPSMLSLGDRRDWGLLHRLDRDTSGVVLAALTAQAYDGVRGQFEARRVRKAYLAVVVGRPWRDRGTVTAPLSELRRGGIKVSVPSPRGLPATTHWRLLAVGPAHALLQVQIETGRLHQIRAHLAIAGFPVAGDHVYRPERPPDTRRRRVGPPELVLHAWRVGLAHPVTGTALEITAPPPPAFVDSVRALVGPDALNRLTASP